MERGGMMSNPDIKIHIFRTENGGENWTPVEVDYGPSGYLDVNALYSRRSPYHHIRLVNDTIGYAVSGRVFCRTPLPDYASWVHIEGLKISDTSVSLYNNDSDLLIKSQKLPIESVRIMDISGKILDIKRWNVVEYERNVNVSAIPKGLYLVKTVLSDNTVCTNKWIKN